MARSWRRRYVSDPGRRFVRSSPLRSTSPSMRVGPVVPAETVLLDGRLVPADQAAVSVFDRGLLYGESLFETLKVVDEAPCLWQQHSDRLARSCAELGIPLDVQALEAGVRRLLLARPVAHGSLRIQVTGGQQPGAGRGLAAPKEARRPHVIALLHETAPYASDLYTGGATAITVRDLRRPLPWLKSGSYLASVWAKTKAQQATAFEALLLEGHPPEILEGSFTNVLLWAGGALVTPLAGRALPGVTLLNVLGIAQELGMETREAAIPLQDVTGNGLLLTSSLLGVCFCASLDGRPLVPLASLAAQLQDALRLREEASVAQWQAGEGGPAARR